MPTADRPRIRRYWTPYAGWTWATFGTPYARRPVVIGHDLQKVLQKTARKFPLTRWVR